MSRADLEVLATDQTGIDIDWAQGDRAALLKVKVQVLRGSSHQLSVPENAQHAFYVRAAGMIHLARDGV